jgi:hypothetical protein
MSAELAITTFLGGFIYPVLIRLIWGKMVENWGPIGGWMAGGFIVGTSWALIHGMSSPFINQTGAWIDMAWAAAIGLFIASAINGGSVKKAIPHLVSSLIGGTIAAVILALV